MKRIIISIAIVTFFATSSSFAASPSYAEGTMLNVFAPSGLKLRAFPNLNGDVLEIVQYGDQVKVLNTFDFSSEKAERIDWIDGHWILVEFGGISGYLFDGYLSAMPFPSSRDEMLMDGYSYAYTIGQYMEQHHQIETVVDSSETSLSYILADGTFVEMKVDTDYWIVEVETPTYQAHEVLNLMRSMIPDRKSRSLFEKSLLFIEDEKGEISEIKVKLGDEAIIRKEKNGNIRIKASGHAGC